MGQIGNGLRNLLEFHIQNLIQHQRQNDSEREFKNTFNHTNGQGVLNQPRSIVAHEKGLEIIKAYPRAPPDSFFERIIFKRQDRPCHRHITDQRIIDDTRYQHQI